MVKHCHFLLAAAIFCAGGCESPLPEFGSLAPVETRDESDGYQNRIHLYAVKGTFNRDDFYKLCEAIKARAKRNGAYTYIVVFDKA